jgi:leucyl-tRNA synthetase
MFELNNELVALATVPREIAEPFVLMLAPFAPHVAEELWERLGSDASLTYAPWPEFDEALLEQETIGIAVQVMGKTRGRITVAADAGEAEIREAALAEPGVQRHVGDAEVRKVIFVPGRLINFVVG